MGPRVYPLPSPLQLPQEIRVPLMLLCMTVGCRMPSAQLPSTPTTMVQQEGTLCLLGWGWHCRAIWTHGLVRTFLECSGHSCAGGRHPVAYNSVFRSHMASPPSSPSQVGLSSSQVGLCLVLVWGGVS